MEDSEFNAGKEAMLDDIEKLREESKSILFQITNSPHLKNLDPTLFCSALLQSNAFLGASKYLIEDNNFIALAVYPRIQLETASRINGLYLADNPNNYSDDLKSGNIKKSKTKKLNKKNENINYSDNYAISELFNDNECLKKYAKLELYKKYSAYIHFSKNSTIAEQLNLSNDSFIHISINEKDHGKSEKEFIELCEDFKITTNILYSVIKKFTSGVITEKA